MRIVLAAVIALLAGAAGGYTAGVGDLEVLQLRVHSVEREVQTCKEMADRLVRPNRNYYPPDE